MTHVLIVEPQSSGLNFIKAARNLGFRVSVLTAARGDRNISKENAQLVDSVLVHDTNDTQGSVEVVRAFHKCNPISCVVPGFEYYVPLTAKIASDLCLKGISVEKVEALRLKNKMRETLQAAQVPVPAYYEVRRMDQVINIASSARFPLVVKPTNLSGSVGVRKVANAEELINGCKVIWENLSSDLDLEPSSEILIEEYVEGPEFSAEGYVLENGTIEFLSITKKLLGPEPWFVETGHIVNCKLDLATESKIKNYLGSVIRALGITIGPFHGEFRLRNRDAQPILMEIGARLAGDKICDLIKLSTGVDLAEVTLRILAGKSVPSRTTNSKHAAGITFFIEKGQKAPSHYLSFLKSFPGLMSLELKEKSSDQQVVDFSGRLGHALFVLDTFELVKQSIDKANQIVAAS